MSTRTRAKLRVVPEPAGPTPALPRRAWLDGITPDGQVRVRFASGAVEQASVATIASDQALLGAIRNKKPVLVSRLDGEDGWVVLGLLRDRLALEEVGPPPAAPHVEIEAEDALTLGCGEAAIELLADGRINLRGRTVLVSATGDTVVQGATVKIN